MDTQRTEKDLGINPGLLRWARERAGLSLEDAAVRAGLKGLKPRGQKKGVDPATLLRLFEDGQKSISWAQLIRVAKAYRRPPLTFFLSSPPVEPVMPPDLRTMGHRPPDHLSPEFQEFYTYLVSIHDTLRDILEQEGGARLPFVGGVSVATPVLRVVQSMRDILDFSLEAQQRVRNGEDLFSALRAKAHAAGIFVIAGKGLDPRHPVTADEFRGMAFCDPVAPLVVVNTADVKAARVFTLVHEFAHVWLGQSALSGFDPLSPGRDRHTPSEIFADQVAAEFLVPESQMRLFHAETGAVTWENLAEGSRRFKVSRAVMARRALDLGILSSDIYRGWMSRLAMEWTAREQRIKERMREQESAVSWTRQIQSRLGKKVLQTISEGISVGVLNARDASAVLRVRQDGLGRLLSP